MTGTAASTAGDEAWSSQVASAWAEWPDTEGSAAAAPQAGPGPAAIHSGLGGRVRLPDSPAASASTSASNIPPAAAAGTSSAAPAPAASQVCLQSNNGYWTVHKFPTISFLATNFI